MIDLHCDTLSALYERKTETIMQNSLAVDQVKLKKAGAFAQFFAAFVDMSRFADKGNTEQGFLYALDLINFGKVQFSAKNSEILVAKSYNDYIKNRKSEKISAFLTVEEGGIIGNDIYKLDRLYQNGVRLITLCWNYENSIGFPNSKNPEIMKKGLKNFGFNVVSEMNEKGIIIDVSHLSDGGFFDVISHSKKPVVASHSSARALCSHPRNLTDEMIKALANCGGVAGVNFYPFFLSQSGKADVFVLADHIEYMINAGGEDFVALGSDFDGFSPPLAGLENIGKTEFLLNTLKSRGISERQLEKLKFLNAERIIKEIL